MDPDDHRGDRPGGRLPRLQPDAEREVGSEIAPAEETGSPPAPATGFAGRLLRSSSAATFSQVWRFGVTFGTHVALRHLLPPSEWGVWNWSESFLFLLLAQVRDLGLPAHVVRDRSRPYGNFLAVELGWGVLLALGIAFASPLVSLAYADPGPTVVAVVRALCLFLILEGLAKVPLIYFEAELLIERALLPEITRNLCFAVVSITLALGGFGVWSLVVAHVAATGVFAALLWLRALPGMRLHWVRGGTWRLVRSSLPLMVMAFLILALDWVDVQVLSVRFTDSALIGRYGGVLFLALLMPRVLELPVRRALYPAFVAVRDQAARFFETYRLATILLMAVQVPFAFFLFLNARTLLVLLWGAEYAQAAPVLQVLCFIPLIQPFARCAEDVILARHEERLLIVASFLSLASLVGLGLWLTGPLGAQGMAWAKLLPLGVLLVTWAVYRVDPAGFRRLAGELALLYALPVPLFALAAWASAGHPYLRLALTAAAGLASAALYLWRWGPGFRRFFAEA